MTVLGFDYGSQKIGVAIGNTISGSARELGSIGNPEQDDWQALDTLFNEWRPEMTVVGLPLDRDGSEQPITRAARKFAAQITDRYGCNVALVDERYSSHEARAQLRDARASGTRPRRLRRGDIDAAAAALLLRAWLADQP